jgi:hypothetical protein
MPTQMYFSLSELQNTNGSSPTKVANTAGSLQLRSLDYAKFGQLYKNEGAWNGKQILSKNGS